MAQAPAHTYPKPKINSADHCTANSALAPNKLNARRTQFLHRSSGQLSRDLTNSLAVRLFFQYFSEGIGEILNQSRFVISLDSHLNLVKPVHIRFQSIQLGRV